MGRLTQFIRPEVVVIHLHQQQVLTFLVSEMIIEIHFAAKKRM